MGPRTAGLNRRTFPPPAEPRGRRRIPLPAFPVLTAGARRAAAGFTLIELVVVMLILTIVLGMVGVRLTRDVRDTVRDEAERLALVLQSAREQAILEGRPYAFALTDEGYQFLRLGDEGRLVPVRGDEILGPRRLPRALTLAPQRPAAAAPARADLILFDPSGEFPAFTMVFAADDVVWYVQGRTDGRIIASPTLPKAA